MHYSIKILWKHVLNDYHVFTEHRLFYFNFPNLFQFKINIPPT